MIVLEGWKSPGRGATEMTHDQIFGIMTYLMDAEKIQNDVWGPPLQLKIGKTINVNTDNTLRHIIGFMKSIGIIYENSLQGGKVPNPDYCVSPSGEMLYSLIKMEKIAIENEENSVVEKIQNMYKQFYANAFLYWFVRDTKIHVARTILKAIKKYGSLDKIEWFILNTFITETDNKEQEEIVDKLIKDYRSGDITLTAENIKKRVNSYNYWAQLLSYAGLIKKTGQKVTIGNKYPQLVEDILADDFYEHLNIRGKYNIQGKKE